MPFQLKSGDLLYTDADLPLLTGPDAGLRGLLPRETHPQFARCGSAPGVPEFTEPNIPRSEWTERIQEMEAKQELVSDLITWPSKYQTINYCWIFAPVGLMEVVRVVMGLPYVELSPASGGGPITDYRDVGGYGISAVTYLAKTGCCKASLWPNNAISRQYDTAASQADRLNYKITGWCDVGTRKFDAQMSHLLRRRPGIGGHDWWQHEVFHCDPVVMLSRDYTAAVWRAMFGRNAELTQYGARIRNSWSDALYGSKNRHGVGGFGVLAENKATAEDYQTIVQTTASET